MPTWGTGSLQELLRREEARTLGGQIQSLTFIDRSPPGPGFTSPHNWGLLLESATNSLLDAGFSIRTQPRYQIGNRSGREYEEPIAISPGRGTIDLVFNPTLALHRALRRPYQLRAPYVIRSIMAPPYMGMVAGIYLHLNAGPAGLNPEDQSIQTVEFLDNFSAEVVPSRLFESTVVDPPVARTDAANPSTTAIPGRLGFRILTDSDEPLVVAPGVTNGTFGDSASLNDAITIAYNPFSYAIASRAARDTNFPSGHPDLASGEFALLSLGQTGPNMTSDNGNDTFLFLHFPGAQGGYLVSKNLNASNLTSTDTLVIDATKEILATDLVLADRIAGLDPLVGFAGFYSTPSDGLLTRI